MIKVASTTKTIICIGTGGVGKTTMSASLASGLSKDKKVLVLTIDPSLRLAQALGIKPDGEVYKVKQNLYACTLNHQKAFQDFVLKAAKSTATKEEIEKLLENKLYKQLSTQLSGSQDFSSLFKLTEFVNSKEYDIVILDTPPAQHTWHFLHAPEKIAQLFNEGVAQWFRDPDQKDVGFFKRVLNTGTSQVLKILENLTGSEFVKELSMFFKAIQRWQTPLEKQVWDCHKVLTAKSTEFILVTALDPSRISEALRLSSEIEKQGYNLKSIIINRVPSWMNEEVSAGPLVRYVEYLKALEARLLGSKSKFGAHLKVYKSQELSHNQLHVENLSDIYHNIELI
ncbi:MAG: ArsA family ATPase [Pseudobdellovibrio sp.]|nr:ArsA family ATPase [Pseudobdellovibrio sp.]